MIGFIIVAIVLCAVPEVVSEEIDKKCFCYILTI